MKRLLLVYHSQSGRTEQLALAVYSAVLDALEDGLEIELSLRRAVDVDVNDVVNASAALFFSPENFASISGGVKDCLDRIFYPAMRMNLQALPYAVVVSAGNDGTGCVRQMDRILSGINAKPIQAALILFGDVGGESEAKAVELGLTVALGLEMGLY